MLETLRLQEGDFVALTQQPNGVLIKQSMNWRMNVHHAAAKQLEAIPPDRRARILADIRDLGEDPFRGLVKRLKGKTHKGLYRKVSGRYRIIFEPIHAIHTVDVLGVFLRNERTYK